MRQWLAAALLVGLYWGSAPGQTPDFDGSGTVDFDDFFLYVDHFGESANDANRIFDLSGDGAVNFDDFFLFVDHFGETVAPTRPGLRVTLGLPPGIPIAPADLRVIAPLGSAALGGSGPVEVATLPPDKPQVVLVEDAAGNPVLLGYALPPASAVQGRGPSARLGQVAGKAGDPVVSPASTALALAMLDPLLFGSSGAQRLELAERVVALPDFPALAARLESRLRASPATVLDGGDGNPVYQEAAALLIGAMRQNLPRDKDIVAAEVERAPWIEDAAGNGLVFVNPNSVYYSWGAIREGGAGYQTAGIVAPGTVSFALDCWPPAGAGAAGRTSPNELPDGAYAVFITRGGDYPVTRLSDLGDPAGRATALNTGHLVWNAVDLLAGAPGLPGSLADLELRYPVGGLNALGTAVGRGDIPGILETVVEVGLGNAGRLAAWLWPELEAPEQDSMASYVGKVLPLLGHAGAALKGLGAVGQVPFAGDLVAAPREVNYQIVQRLGRLERQNRAVTTPAGTPHELVGVPSGTFAMGSDRGYIDERPGHEVYLDRFYIDRFEVTVAQYRACVTAGVCLAPAAGDGFNWGHADRDAHPVNGVSWVDARAYCQWAGLRLPTEAEWEKAARGTDGRTYPWGEETASCDRAVMDAGGWGCGRDSTWPVGSKPQGVSPYGAHDMAGNVWEWAADWYDEEYYAHSPSRNPTGPVNSMGTGRVLRGGSWTYYPYFLRATVRVGLTPAERGMVDLGFRCAQD
jgi:formylglycine-generating enzyme